MMTEVQQRLSKTYKYGLILQPERVDVAKCTGLPVTLVFLPAADIAAYVGMYLLATFRGNFSHIFV